MQRQEDITVTCDATRCNAMLWVIAIPGLLMSAYSVALLNAPSRQQNICGRYALTDFHNGAKFPAVKFRSETLRSTFTQPNDEFQTYYTWIEPGRFDITIERRAPKPPLLYSCLGISACEFTCVPHPTVDCGKCTSRIRGYVDVDGNIIAAFEASTGGQVSRVSSIS